MRDFSLWTSEKRLLRLAKKGDTKAVKDLMELLLKPAHSLAWRILRNEAEAEEVIQEAILKLWRSSDSFEGNSSLRTYFFKIVMRECYSCIKLKKQHEQIETIFKNESEISSFEIDLKMHQDMVQQALDSLTSKQRMALVLWAFHDMTAPEIGDVMELNKNAVDQLLWRAKSSFREKLAG